MPDREKVIRAWEIFRNSNPYEICSGREFRAIREPEYCMSQMIEDTIALLKEQEAVEPECQIIFDVPYYFCGSCKTMLNMYAVKAKYCSNCGRRVKWK